MYLVNLEPLEHIWPFLILVVIGLCVGYAWMKSRDSPSHRSHREREKRYWLDEMQWRARSRAYSFVNRFRAPRLTDQRDRKD